MQLTLVLDEAEVTVLLGAIPLTLNTTMASHDSETSANQKSLIEIRDQVLALQTKIMATAVATTVVKEEGLNDKNS